LRGYVMQWLVSKIEARLAIGGGALSGQDSTNGETNGRTAGRHLEAGPPCLQWADQNTQNSQPASQPADRREIHSGFEYPASQPAA
jgi:hypothetical protein